jgi:hypothetical protein
MELGLPGRTDRTERSNNPQGREAGADRGYDSGANAMRITQEWKERRDGGYGDQNPALTHGYRMGTALNKITPDFIEPVSGGFRSQEFTVRLERA